MIKEGILISSPDINNSSYTFTPDSVNNVIHYGLAGIARMNDELIKTIILNRPYSSVRDFASKVKVNKLQMINLIKSGAFDQFGNRTEIMQDYICSIAGLKQKLNMQNLGKIVEYDLLPVEYDFNKKLFNFNKYLKSHKDGDYYIFDDISYGFFDKNFDLDFIEPYNDTFRIKKCKWKALYDVRMKVVKKYIQDNQETLLNRLNECLFNTMWNKYCTGDISSWEMDSIGYYYHEHELKQMKIYNYGCERFCDLPEEPEIDRIITTKQGNQIKMYKLTRIAGTIINKNRIKKRITLLTAEGDVIDISLFGDTFTYYDKQISEKLPNGKKHIIEKSMLSRGNKIVITGMRTGKEFVPKKYKNTPYPLIQLILNLDKFGYCTFETR